MQFFNDVHYNIVSKRKMGYFFSGTLILISIISLILHGGPRYNIDFTGGTFIQMKFQKDIEIQPLRTVLQNAGYSEVELKHFGAPNEVAIRAGV